MEDKKKISIKYLHCPSCFFNWSEQNETTEKETDEVVQEEKKCSFCEKTYTSLELLFRQIEVMPSSYASDFPKVMKHLLMHIDLKS